jgi:glycine/D-amino acid oxidase-like deaminating enzyme
MGGPEGLIDTEYRPDLVHHPGAYEELEFMAGTIEHYQGPPDWRWKGLMGYTSSGARVVGRDPQLPTLFYNLGCNGNGLMSAVAGAVRVVKRLKGEDLPPSVFDPEVIVEKERIVQRAR